MSLSEFKQEDSLLSNKVQRFLDGLYVSYSFHTNVNVESTRQFSDYARSLSAHAIKAVLFSDKRGPLLVVYDAKDGLDFDALFEQTGRSLGLDSGYRYRYQLNGYSIRHLPPFGRLFQIPMVMDQNLLHHKRYLLELGEGKSFLEIDSRGFEVLFSHASVKSFARQIGKIPVIQQTASKTPVTSDKSGKVRTLLNEKTIEEQFTKGVNLPSLSGISKRLLAMRSESSVDVDELVHLIRTDPVITAKLISYAQSPYFAYQRKLDSLHEAIFHVLGLDLTMNTALAMSMSQLFSGPMEGPFGANNIWKHAVHSAVLTQSIATSVSQKHKINAGEAYLYALMQNIYPNRYRLFNKAVIAKRSVPVHIIEKKILGVSHVKVGTLLMKTWGMPMEYSRIIENHHSYGGKGSLVIYSDMIYLSNCLLKMMDMGDSSDSGLPETMMKKYSISEQELENMLEIIMSWNENLDFLASQLVA